jgi:uncharacterized membrane-anchored protein
VSSYNGNSFFIAYYFLKLNAILAFWIAYILTRPLGASLGDLLTQDGDAGGWGIDPLIVSLVFLVGIVGIVAYFTFSENKSRNQF